MCTASKVTFKCGHSTISEEDHCETAEILCHICSNTAVLVDYDSSSVCCSHCGILETVTVFLMLYILLQLVYQVYLTS